ncbi:hypothetical protein ILUMI_23397 [Ignelater luminosus]|uniref:Adhesion G protein-coupled receptor A3 n=1 Tax=Ignelater luminosus TaxID=2038154 RepID=A0A8K0C8V8_IGNLU|nr:hypothetical protein ILUMI_23397 [Ignelater luminosus]
MARWILKSSILLYFLVVSKSIDECPKNCVCKHSSQRDGPDWIKVRCGDIVPVNSLDELDLLNIASEIVQLNLTRNRLTAFTPKIQFVALQKLDISKNQLTALYNNQFIEVPNLRRLDISGNNIKHIDVLSFANLRHLERLKLNQNEINTITKGTFKSLMALKQLDISNNPLTCDCDLLWLLGWIQKTSLKLMSNPKCASPATFKGIALRKLQIGIDIHCKSPAGSRELPVIKLEPNQSQVVFEGDTLKLVCTAPSLLDNFDVGDSQGSSYIEWLWLDSDPKNHFDEIEISNRFSIDSGLLISSLKISTLNRNHTGIWSCRLNSTQGNYSEGLMLIVISDATKYCPILTTTNNKGTYMWPRTVVNYTVTIPCESIQLNRDVSQQQAAHFCSPSGDWIHLNTSQCAYISETTKILEQFSKVNLSLTKGSIYESAKHFKNYTSNLKIFRDVMDLEYTIQTIENYVHYLPEEKELGGILMDVLNNVIELSRNYLEEADLEYNILRKIINLSEHIAEFTTAPIIHKSNIAVEEFPVKQEVFAGMTCTWYINSLNSSDRLFYCITSNRPVLSGMQDRIIEASIQIPASLFYQLQQQDIVLDRSMQRILIGMFSNGKLFPVYKKYSGLDITTAVVGVKLANFLVTNLTEPIYVMLRLPPRAIVENTIMIPVWWNATSNEGKGNWSSEGCELSHEVQDNIVFHCKQLGYYGLLQNVSNTGIVRIGAKFRLSHPAIYVGSFILFLSLFIVILTYCICYMSIQMPKKAKHSLVNMWIAVVLLIFVYVFGIYQTEDLQLCQIIGLTLHYFTLCTLFWMCVGLTTMYKRLSKNDNTIELQDDELPSDQPIQKPILGLYLIGWGVALMVCGISGAVNMKEYAAHTHCFLSSTPALSALFIPAVVLLLILSALFLLIRCAIYSSDANGHLSEGTQVTENVDLDLLEPSFPNPDHTSVRSSSTKTRSSEVEDAEHAPATQLKAYTIFLILYILTWFSCALATVKPFRFQYEEDIFSIIYAILATVLGAFTLFFYCIARNDIRTQWLLLHNWIKRKGVCFRSRNISDAAQNIPQIQIQPLPLPPAGNSPPAEIHITSRSSSRSSSHTKSNSNNSNVLKAAVNLNGSTMEEPHGARINNVNLVVLHRQQYRTNNTITNFIENPANTAQVFYNPYQSTVARRFFKKQRQHMMKRNNLTMRKCTQSDSASIISSKHITDNSSIDQSIFGTNSKVNNTNIHVEHVCKTKHRNPNVLSDSHEEISLNNVPIEKTDVKC